MGLPGRMLLALRGAREARIILVCDSHKSVGLTGAEPRGGRRAESSL
jgi:hypothetical protein